MNNLLRTIAITKPSTLPDQPLDSSTVATVLHFAFALAGILALLMITIASLRYVISRGDSENVKKAKNTILYALVGLGIAMSGYGIVSFVFRKVQ